MKKSFTLIELLIVIAIIAILAGMLLPALNAAKERGRSASCQNKVKQIGGAMSMYLASNDDIFPTSETHTDLLIGTTWSDVLLPYLGYDQNSNAHLKRSGVFVCPSQQNVHESWKAYISYGINRDFVGRENYQVRQWASSKIGPVKATSVRKPSSHLIVAETWYSANRTQTCNVGSLKLPARTLGNYVAHHNSIAFRHARRANTLYIDGHVASDDQAWLWMGHPLYLPWNVGNEKTTFSTYPNRNIWDIAYGYDPYL